jgi:sugar phosphate isomerase/epimerase
MARIVSITRRAERVQLEDAKRAGFAHVELWTDSSFLTKGTLRDEIGRTRSVLRKTGMRANSVVMPKSPTLEAFEGNARLTIALAKGVGAKVVVADYPKYRGKDFRERELDFSGIEGKPHSVRGALWVMASPTKAAEALRRLKRVADRKGIKFVIEPPGGSDIGAKQIGFRNWRELAKAGHGLVLDLEHVAQQIIVQPLEEVHNPALRAMKGKATWNDVAAVFSFYDDYKAHMDAKSRKAFEKFLSLTFDAGTLKGSGVRDAAKALYKLAKPEVSGLGSGATPESMSIKPSKWSYDLLVRAWGSLPIQHIHLTGGHLGEALRPSEVVPTLLGPSDKGFEHSYVIEREKGNAVVIGSKPGQSLYDYLHIRMGGRLYANKEWHRLAADLLRNSKKAAVNFKPGANFELKPEDVRKRDIALAKRL